LGSILAGRSVVGHLKEKEECLYTQKEGLSNKRRNDKQEHKQSNITREHTPEDGGEVPFGALQI
jgi:hypothetical protein